MSDLAALRAENVAAWRRDTRLPDYDRQVVDATSRYLPALEAEVERLRAEVEGLTDAYDSLKSDADRLGEDLRIANEATLVLVERAAKAESALKGPVVAMWSSCCKFLRPGDDWTEGSMHDGLCRYRHEGDLGPTLRLVVGVDA